MPRLCTVCTHPERAAIDAALAAGTAMRGVARQYALSADAPPPRTRRQAKWVAAGVYQPSVRPRAAYGRRRGSCPLLDTGGWTSSRGIIRDVLEASQPPPGLGVARVAVAMPHGGVRWLIVCPCCRAQVTRLYGEGVGDGRGSRYACRQCRGLRYRSQYQGRRLEAHLEACAALLEASRTATTPRARERRQARSLDACVAVAQRLATHHARRELAETIAMTVLLTREINRENEHWARRVLPYALRDTPEIRRQLATSRDTPAWARKLLRASLEADETMQNASESPLDTSKTPETVSESVSNAPLAAALAPERIAELREQYRAMGQARRHAKAA